MTKKNKKEINKAIKELKKFIKICDKAYIECGFNRDVLTLKCEIQDRIDSLRKLKKL